MDDTVLIADRPTTQVVLPWAPRCILRVKDAGNAAVGEAVGVALPIAACSSAQSAEWRVLWLGPDEWLLIGSPDVDPAAFAQRLAGMSLPHSLVEISDRQIAVSLSGPRAASVLNAACPLDLALPAFPVGMCTRTIFGKAEIVLWREAEDRFRIEVWRSFGDYVRQLLDLVIAEHACERNA